MRGIAFAMCVVALQTSVAFAATVIVPGSPFRTRADVPQDGYPSYLYDANTGEFFIDGEGVGLFYFRAESVAGVFRHWTLPSGLFPVATPHEVSVVINAGSGNTLQEARLANLGAGQTIDFLRQDLTLFWNNSYGGPGWHADLAIIDVPEPTALGLVVVATFAIAGPRQRPWEARG